MASSTDNAVGELFDVKGLVVVITGGGTGIGRMYATALENNGAIVYIVGRRLEPLEQTVAEASKFGKMIPLQADVTDNEAIAAIAAKIEAEQGYINLLINNAGIMANFLPKQLPKDIKDLQSALWSAGTTEEFDTTFKINVRAPYYTTVAFLHLLHEGNQRTASRGLTSQVITISSIGGFRRDSEPASVSYYTSKAAATHLGKLLTSVLRDHDIRSNIICPGIFPTEMSGAFGIGSGNAKDFVPLKRFGTSDDMAGLILYMASKAASYLNGSVQLIDGGRLSLFASTW